MITAVIIEDEQTAKDSLVDDLNSYCPEVKVIGHASSVKSGIECISQLKPMLVFMDIHLTDGTGLDLLKRMELQLGGTDKFSFQIIFTTASDKHAIEAIKFSASDYLLKPVDPDDLIVAVNRVKNRLQQPDKLTIQTLLDNNSTANQSKKIVLKSADSISVYSVSEIIRLESQRNYTMFYFKNEKPLLVSTTLGEYDELLNTYGFVRTHHSHLININYLKKFIKADGGYIEMIDGSHVPVAQRKKEQILALISSL